MRARRDRVSMRVSAQRLNQWPARSCRKSVTNHNQTISDLLQHPIPTVHAEQMVMKAQVKKRQFLRVQVTVKVRRACNPRHCIRLNPACRFNACWTSIGRNCMLLFIFPLSDETSWHIHIVLMHCFEHQYLCYVNIVALRLIMGLGLNDAVYTGYYMQHLNVSDHLWPVR